MREIRDNKIQKVDNPKNMTIITIKESDFIDFIGFDDKGYKISYNQIKSCYFKSQY